MKEDAAKRAIVDWSQKFHVDLAVLSTKGNIIAIQQANENAVDVVVVHDESGLLSNLVSDEE